jgi:hypothetical protein
MLTFISGCLEQQAVDPNTDKWVSLFNGKNLDGWTPKITGYELGENPGDMFRAENGVMKVSYDGHEKFTGQFGHIFYKDKFSHYRLRLEYRFIGEQLDKGPGWAYRNSGIMLHCQDPKSMSLEQKFPVSLEAQLLGGNGKKERATGNLCTPGTNVVIDGKLETKHCFTAKSETYHGDQWVTAEVEVHGDRIIKHIINGQVVIEYQDPQFDPKDANAKKLIAANNGDLTLSEGYISLQAESHPLEFKNIEILLLDE